MATDNFLSPRAFYIRVSPLSLLVRESFGSPLFFAPEIMYLPINSRRVFIAVGSRLETSSR
jgi:hypothetical protein